jgi:hypothetical protein
MTLFELWSGCCFGSRGDGNKILLLGSFFLSCMLWDFGFVDENKKCKQELVRFVVEFCWVLGLFVDSDFLLLLLLHCGWFSTLYWIGSHVWNKLVSTSTWLTSRHFVFYVLTDLLERTTRGKKD